jgi:hypothetical protein
MRASKVLLRWYRSFNTRYHGYEVGNGQPLPWDAFRGQSFPFVEIPLDRQITTIVGANESGKSHLLSAIAKVFTGHGIGDESGLDYAIQDICRYCAFEGLEENIWPTIGIEMTFDTSEEFTAFVQVAGFTVPSAEDATTVVPKRCVIILDGAQSDGQVASVYSIPAMAHLGNIAKSKWREIAGAQLPALQFINAKIALSNEVHVRQLIDLYDKKSLTPACDPLALQGLVEMIAALSVEENKPVAAAVIEAIKEAKSTLQNNRVGVQSTGELELKLFRDVLRIPKATLEMIAKLGNSDRGFVERLVGEINHRLDETLDLTHFWQQDDQFHLSVDYKSGFFFFEITDKTGAKYTFNERSSGLRYFLSYYIQAKAIERANEQTGSIVLMDEPDSFLSIAGQRNLLQVFESLVSVKSASGTCQLVYTTHSPFLINRNFPKRVVLVRKGDGSEGTQFVPRSAVRRYEPIRSALGVDCAETLFMGATNIVVEGVTDQRILIAAIQRFGDNGDVDRYLNMNTVTFVTAGGAPNIARLVSKSILGDEKRPVVVVLVDGDVAGSDAFQELTAGKILDQDFVTTIDQITFEAAWVKSVVVFEDIIPPSLLALAIHRCLNERWKEDVPVDTIATSLAETPGSNLTSADRVIATAKSHLGTQAKIIRDEELKGLILDTFAECLLDEQCGLDEKGLKEFEINVGLVCGKLRQMIDSAERRYQRDSMQKCVRLAVNNFQKSHHRGASRADVERCLGRLESECSGFTQEAVSARENINQFRESLLEEVAEARHPVDISAWSERFKHFQQCPWKKVSARKQG